MMDRFVFYYNWSEHDEPAWDGWIDYWAAGFPLRIVSATKPERLVDVHNPLIEWVDNHDDDWIELPSLSHVPVRGPLFGELPSEKKVAVPVLEHGWISYTVPVSGCNDDLFYAEAHHIYIECRLTKEQWEEWCIKEIEEKRNDMEGLSLSGRRRLCGMALALKEWVILHDVSPLCEWDEPWATYDKLHSSLRMERRNGSPENSLELQQTLWKLDCPPAWHDLMTMYAQNPEWDKNVLCAELLGKHLEPWSQAHPPLGRWVLEKQWSVAGDYFLYYKLLETPYFRQPTLQKWKMRFLFSNILGVKDRNVRVCFTQGILEFLPRLCRHEQAERGDLLHSTDDIDFVPSSSSIIPYPENPKWCLVNVRKVNYRILPSGHYVTMRGGKINTECYNGISKNEFYVMDRETLRPLTSVRPMSEEGLPNHRQQEMHIVGLEDVRLVQGKNMDVLFYAVTKSFSYMDAIRIISGKYDFEHGVYKQTRCIHPPYEENACEKNWTWCGHNRYIYRWHPIEIGSVENDSDKLVIEDRIQSPPYFGEFRGSTPAVQWRGFSFFAVHSVSHGNNGRRYIHYVVVLDLEKKRTLACTPPFCFEDTQIEYTIGMDIYKGKILFLYSTRDSTARYVRVPLRYIIDNLQFMSKESEDMFYARVLNDF